MGEGLQKHIHPQKPVKSMHLDDHGMLMCQGFLIFFFYCCEILDFFWLQIQIKKEEGYILFTSPKFYKWFK
jgi:hypothetical protein